MNELGVVAPEEHRDPPREELHGEGGLSVLVALDEAGDKTEWGHGCGGSLTSANCGAAGEHHHLRLHPGELLDSGDRHIVLADVQLHWGCSQLFPE